MFKKIALGCAIVFVLMALFISGMLYYGSTELKPHVLGILELYNEGSFDRIYSNASTELKAQVPEEKLKATLETIQQTFGKFLEAGTVSGTSRNATATTSTAEVTLGLRFEKAQTTGKFEFVKNEGDWRLLGLYIDPPQPDVKP